MPERNTDEVNRIVGRVRELAERYRAAHYADVERLGLPLTESRLIDHADNLEALCKTVDALTAAAIPRRVKRAVREAIRKAVKQVIIHGAPLGTDEAPFFAALDKLYPAIPLPIPPCPLSGGREVRWIRGNRHDLFDGGTLVASLTRMELMTEARTTTDLRTLADWLDSLPDAERGKA